MLKIFAKFGTNEKALVPVPPDKVGEVLLLLNEMQGGSWVLVDHLNPGELLLFKDSSVYLGYDFSERYTDAICKIPK